MVGSEVIYKKNNTYTVDVVKKIDIKSLFTK